MQKIQPTHISDPTIHRPGFVSVQLPKKQLEEKGSTGFGLRIEDGLLKIINISPDGLLAQTDIHAGDTLTLIDGACPPVVNTAEELQGFVSNAMFSPSGSPNVTVTVKTSNGDPTISEAVVFKEDLSTRIGLFFNNNPNSGFLQICEIEPNGLLGPYSALQVGDYIEQVNGCDIKKFDAKKTTAFLKSIAGQTTIRVHRLPVGVNASHTGTGTTTKNPHVAGNRDAAQDLKNMGLCCLMICCWKYFAIHRILKG